MKSTWWKSGDWNAICDVCGFKYKASHLKLRWDGLMCCPTDWEIRHPQELIRPIPDQSKLPWTRPEASNTFIAVCTVEGRSDLPMYAVAGCSIPGYGLHGTPSFCSPIGLLGQSDFGTANCSRADNPSII